MRNGVARVEGERAVAARQRLVMARQRQQRAGAMGLRFIVARVVRRNAVERDQRIGETLELVECKPAADQTIDEAAPGHERAIEAFQRVGVAAERHQQMAAIGQHFGVAVLELDGFVVGGEGVVMAAEPGQKQTEIR